MGQSYLTRESEASCYTADHHSTQDNTMTFPVEVAARLHRATSIEIVPDNARSPAVSQTSRRLKRSRLRRSRSFDRWQITSSSSRPPDLERSPSFPPSPQLSRPALRLPNDKIAASTTPGAEPLLTGLRKPMRRGSPPGEELRKRADAPPSKPMRRHDVNKTLDCLTQALSIAVVNPDIS